LYPLQDKVLQVLNHARIPHYLTGGTALTRAYFNHRYSDDLDFFLNYDSHYTQKTKDAVSALQQSFVQVELNNIQPFFQRIIVHEDEISLKVEFINDVGYRYGTPVSTPLFYQTDNVRNILRHKLCALERKAAKDMADLIEICKHMPFEWEAVIEDAKSKDAWLNELTIVEHLKDFDLQKLFEDVKWVVGPSLKDVEAAVFRIRQDIIKGGQNSIYLNNSK